MTTRRYAIVVAGVVVVTLIRIAGTHLTFAQTLDEPVHVAAGHEWLTQGTYRLDFEHPPLPRALFALPFLHDRATPEHRDDNLEYGNDLFALDDHYIHNVAKARRGNLLFMAIAAAALAASTRKLFGDAAAIVALVLFVSLPAVLAHAGLATTDMAAVAGFAVGFHALLLWSEVRTRRTEHGTQEPTPPVSRALCPVSSEPTWPRTLLLGVAIAFGICSKYSFVFFFPAALVVLLIARRRFAIAKLLVAGVVALILTWGVFAFSFRSMAESNPTKALAMIRAAHLPERWAQVRVPAPDLLLGFVALRVHNTAGHAAYLFGRVSQSGWWYYFPVALAIKTPIPYLILAVAGVALLATRRRDAIFLAFVAAAMLLIAMSSRINIGVRHVLPLYVPLSMIAAFAAVELWRAHRAARCAVAAALVWLIVGSAAAHPDYIPWMNAFAGRQPQRVLLDSNFDWGQDIWRLANLCHKRNVTWLGYAVVTNIRASSIGITGGEPLREDAPPAHGPAVISEQNLELARVRNAHAYAWLDGQRFERVGKTLRLYFFSQ